MKISIKATNITLTDSIRLQIEQKIGELEKFIKVSKDRNREIKAKPAYEAWVEVGKTTRHHKKGDVFRAEVQIHLPGKSLRVESENVDLYQAIDETRDELKAELNKYKEKQITKHKRDTRKLMQSL